jgi:hypothetical protein
MDSLIEIKKYAQEVEACWNGKDEGRAEERAMVAKDIIVKLNELADLLEELEDF